MNKLKLYLQESYDELKHNVTWPTWGELIQTAGVVLIASVIIAVVIFGMDTVVNLILKLVYHN